MSRIGKKPVLLPLGVEIDIEEKTSQGIKITVKGKLGTLTRVFRPEIKFTKEDNKILVEIDVETKKSAAFHGLSRTLLNNMVVGVSDGFTKKLEIVGVGYRAQVQGSKLILSLGYSHPVEVEAPSSDIKFAVEDNTKLSITGNSKEDVGEVAALIRSYRPPEPYKGKGVKYAGERIVKKAGKAGKK
ncbi:MAG: 50S ribosomal protein L6 [Cyanobacteria bacterium P01_H01_bin.74]